MEIKKRKIEGLDESRLKELLFSNYQEFGFPSKKQFENYLKEIKDRIQNRYIYIIPKEGEYVVFLKDYPEVVLAFFGEDVYKPHKKEYKMESDIEEVETPIGPLHKAKYVSNLGGDLYIIGRYGALKVKENQTYFRKFDSYYFNLAVSRVHLLVKPYEDRIEILNVGLNEIEILPYKEWREKLERKKKAKKEGSVFWLLPTLILISGLLTILLPNFSGHIIASSPMMYNLIDILVVVSFLSLTLIYLFKKRKV